MGGRREEAGEHGRGSVDPSDPREDGGCLMGGLRSWPTVEAAGLTLLAAPRTGRHRAAEEDEAWSSPTCVLPRGRRPTHHHWRSEAQLLVLEASKASRSALCPRRPSSLVQEQEGGPGRPTPRTDASSVEAVVGLREPGGGQGRSPPRWKKGKRLGRGGKGLG